MLPPGTQVWAGRSRADFRDGFDSQIATVISGEGAGTQAEIRIDRLGEPFLIARLGIMPESEPIASDRAAADALLGDFGTWSVIARHDAAS